MSVFEQAITGFERSFPGGDKPLTQWVPGRVNLIGEHIDYHGLPVLPMAIQRRIVFAFQARRDERIVVKSEQQGDTFHGSVAIPFVAGRPGDWGNYVRAAAEALRSSYKILNGLDGYIASDLPSAAGLSSSSALLIAFSLALLRVNGTEPELHDLARLLPDAEQLVGTRGGGMDHVTILTSQTGHATLITSFDPLAIEFVPVPPTWRFLVAHSLVHAEKSSGAREAYNAVRAAGTLALQKLGFVSYRDAIASSNVRLSALDNEQERDGYLHVTTEARRVQEATAALRNADPIAFGRLLNESHASLRDRLRVSVPAVDELVICANKAGAFGARMTGAGFGGCVVCLCSVANVESVARSLVRNFYAVRREFDPDRHLFVAEASAGALQPEASLGDNDRTPFC